MEFNRGDAVWIKDSSMGWIEGTIISESNSHGVFKVEVGTDSREVDGGNILFRNATLNEDLLDDLTHLSIMNEASVLNVIRKRYNSGDIYTFCGIVLTAVNPYSQLSIYDKEIIWTYHQSDRSQLSPHLFTIAEEAFRSLILNGEDQTIIVSGESGAGKTVSAKYIMRYLAEVGKRESLALDCLSEMEQTIEEKVLATNPILEAFGNAKTLWNDNSSRFGKFIEIFYDERDHISGAELKIYLLEKSRVVVQSEGERNFHIFHQLLLGCPEPERKNLFLDSAEKFNYADINNTIDGYNDAEMFLVTKSSMHVAGFSEEEQWALFKIVAGILHIGNINIQEEDERAFIADDSSLSTSSTLLGVDSEQLKRILLSRTIKAGGETIESPNNKKLALSLRDSLAKYLYEALFLYIVVALNKSLSPKVTGRRKIGILDIYGFEKFKINSFEQFCINFANEKLQSIYNKQIFQLEQQLYSEEGIDWTLIPFSDNQPCISLIEDKLGIIDILDEECRFPNGTDTSFIKKIFSVERSPTISSFLINQKVKAEEHFGIRHYAYDVFYDAFGFLDKNRDQIPSNFHELFASSTSSILSKVVKNFIERTSECKSIRKSGDNLSQSSNSAAISFRHSLIDLVETLSRSKCHYIRCVKPNLNKNTMEFNPTLVLQQLRSCGVLETIKISASGYPGRWTFEDFIERFSMLLPSEYRVTNEATPYNCKVILDMVCSSDTEFQIGKSLVFMQHGVLASLEKLRLQKLISSSENIQKCVKSMLVERKFRATKGAMMRIVSACNYRLSRAKLRYLAEQHLATILNPTYRLYRDLNYFGRTLRAVRLLITIPSILRAREITSDLRRDGAAQKIVTVVRSKKCQSQYSAVITTVRLVQGMFRARKSKLRISELKKEAFSISNLTQKCIMYEERLAAISKEKENLEKFVLENPTSERKFSREVNSLDESISNELEELRERCKEQLLLIQKLDERNMDLQSKNDILEERISTLQKEIASQRKLELSLIHKEYSCETPPVAWSHVRRLSLDSKLSSVGSLVIPRIRKDTVAHEESLDNVKEIRRLLEEEDCRKGIMTVLDSSIKIALSSTEPQLLRLPYFITAKWIRCWLQCEGNSILVRDTMNLALERIKILVATESDLKVPFTDPSIVSPDVNFRFAYWIANLFDLVSHMQHLVTEITQDEADKAQLGQEHRPSEHLLVVLQLRTDVARFIETLYRAWVMNLFRTLSPIAVAAILDYQGLSGFSAEEASLKDSTFRHLMIPLMKFASGSGKISSATMEDLVFELDALTKCMATLEVEAEIASQILNTFISHFCTVAFNQLILRKNFASWKRAIQIQYNISRLEEWIKEVQVKYPGLFFVPSRVASPLEPRDATDNAFIPLEPLVQAVKLIQLAKTNAANDVKTLIDTCSKLNVLQIRKILSIYVPDAYEDGPVNPAIIESLTKLINEDGVVYKETIAEPHPQSLPIQLSIRPREFYPPSLPVNVVPSTLYKIFTLFDHAFVNK